VQANRYWRGHTITVGATASRESLEDSQPAYGRALDVRYANTAAYVQDDWTLGRGLQLVTGVRVDRHSEIARPIASPRAALRWSPRENLDVRTSIARGFRAPQAFDEDLHLTSIGGEAVIIRQAPDLREERSRNLLAGVEWKPLAFGGQALLEANVFSTRLDDQFFNIEHPEPVTQALEFLKVNLGSAHVFGAEFNAGWGIGDDLVIQGGVVVQRARLGEPDPDFGSRDFFRLAQRLRQRIHRLAPDAVPAAVRRRAATPARCWCRTARAGTRAGAEGVAAVPHARREPEPPVSCRAAATGSRCSSAAAT
jgi:outer membrane receptor for ferrienterochelin and colicins